MSFLTKLNKKLEQNLNEAKIVKLSDVIKGSKITYGEALEALYAKFGTSIISKAGLKGHFTEDEIHPIINDLFAAGYLDKPSTGKYQVNQTGIDYASKASVADLKDAEQEVLGSDDLEGLGGEEEAKAAENTGEIAQGVRDIGKLKVKKFITPNVGNNSKYKDQVKTILSHMKSSGQGLTKTTFLLAGDVGVGKCLASDQEITIMVSDELYNEMKDLGYVD